MEKHGVSKGTIIAAIRELRDEGLISRAARDGRLVVLDIRPIRIDLSVAAPW